MQEPDGAIPWTTGAHTDVWNHLESAMALTVAGEDARGRASVRVGAVGPAAGRLLGDEVRRRLGRGRQRRDEHVGLPRRGRVAPLAGAPRPGVRGTVLAGRAPWARLGRLDAAALRWHRVGAGVVRRPAGEGPRGRLAGGVVQRLPVAAGRGVDRRADGRPPTGVGAGGRPAASRAARARRPVPRQVGVLDGLVLPGPGRRGPRRRGRRHAGGAVGRVRGAGARRPLRLHQPVGDRRRDLRAGARPRGPR